MLKNNLNVFFPNYDELKLFIVELEWLRKIYKKNVDNVLKKERKIDFNRWLLSELTSGDVELDLDLYSALNKWNYSLLKVQEVNLEDKKSADYILEKDELIKLKEMFFELEKRLKELWIYDFFDKAYDVFDELNMYFLEWDKVLPEKLLDKQIHDILDLKGPITTIKHILFSLSRSESYPPDVLDSLKPHEKKLKDIFGFENLEDFINKMSEEGDWFTIISFLSIFIDFYDVNAKWITFRDTFDPKIILLIQWINTLLDKIINKAKIIDKTFIDNRRQKTYSSLYEELGVILQEKARAKSEGDFSPMHNNIDLLVEKVANLEDAVWFMNYAFTKNDINLSLFLYSYFFERKKLDLSLLDFSDSKLFNNLVKHNLIYKWNVKSITRILDKALELWDDLSLDILYLLKLTHEFRITLENKDLSMLLKYAQKNKANKKFLKFIKESCFFIDKKIKIEKKKWKYWTKISKRFIEIRNYDRLLDVIKHAKKTNQPNLVYKFVLNHSEANNSFYLDILMFDYILFDDWIDNVGSWFDYKKLLIKVWYSDYYLDYYKKEHLANVKKLTSRLHNDRIKIKKIKEKKQSFSSIKDLINRIEKLRSKDELKQEILNLRQSIFSIVNESVSRSMDLWDYDNQTLSKWTKIWIRKESRLLKSYKNNKQETEDRIIYLATWKKWLNTDALFKKYSIDTSLEENVDTILAKNNLKTDYISLDLILWLDVDEKNDSNISNDKESINWNTVKWYDSFPKYELVIKQLQTLGYIWNIVSILETDSFYNVLVVEIDSEFKTIFVSDNYWNATYVVDGYISKDDINDNEWNIAKIIKDRNIKYKAISLASTTNNWVEAWKKRLITALWLIQDKKELEEIQLKNDLALYNILSGESILLQIQAMELWNFPIKWKEFAISYNKNKQNTYEKIDENYITVIRRLGWNSYISHYKNSSLFIKEYILALLKKDYDIVQKIEFNLILNHEPTVNRDKVLDFVSKIISWDIKLKDRLDLINPKNTKDLLLDNSIDIPYWVTSLNSLLILIWWKPNISTSIDYIYAILDWNNEIINYLEKKNIEKNWQNKIF